jgi:predicted negative regulator of RcsB-dependent stress response
MEQLKTWWKEYGNYVFYGIVLGAAVIIGANYWRQNQVQQAEAASALYEQMVSAAQERKGDAVRAAGTKLLEDFASSPYAGKAALFLAKASFDAGDKASARSQLQWAIDNASEDATRHVARLRLGRLLLDQGELDGVLALTQIDEKGGFTSEYEELRGDVLARQGRNAEARTAYQAALKALPADSRYARTLSMKLDDLGPEPQA